MFIPMTMKLNLRRNLRTPVWALSCATGLNRPPAFTFHVLPSTCRFRWNPHRSPSLPRPHVGVLSADTSTITRQAGESVPVPDQARVLGQASLPQSCGLSLGEVNYLMVDYLVGQPRSGRDRGEGAGAAADSREGSRPGTGVETGTGAELMVFVNDPGRSGSPVLSVKLDMWKLIELGG